MAYNPVLRAPSPDYDAPSFQQHNSDYNQSSYGLQEGHDSTQHFQPYSDDPNANPMRDLGGSRGGGTYEKRNRYAQADGRRRMALIFVVIAVIILVVLAVALPVYFVVIRPRQLNASGGANSGGSHASGTGTATGSAAEPTSTSGSNLPITGGDGSIVTLEDGSTFVYNNSHGGYWVWDENDPFNSGARAQSSTPALNETWKWGEDKIYGVNLGGWLTIEPFITPALFQKYPGAVDEWTLSEAMAADAAGGGINQIEEHYKTFITEKDFAEIAAAGLNWVRISLPFWSIEVMPGEPYLPKKAWTYFLKAVQWARKYGIRINLDLHTLPGSQNGWNHSGRLGQIGVLNSTMGVANAQRSLNYIRTLAQFISQDQYSNVVPFFGVINEPNGIKGPTPPNIPQDTLSSMYLEIYDMIRNNITGTGTNKGPMISIHDAFLGVNNWNGFMAGADRLAIDNHNYFAFSDQLPGDVDAFVPRVCGLADMYTQSLTQFGFTTIGEWSNAINDCGLFVNNISPDGSDVGTRYEGTYKPTPTTRMGDCAPWVDYTTWPAERKTNFQQYMLASFEAYEHSFFWTWKIGPSLASGRVEAPFWSYQLAIQEGWAPANPSEAVGSCAKNGSPANTFNGQLQPWQTGGAGGGITDAQRAQAPWPPISLADQPNAAALPTYTATGAIITMPAPTFTKPGTTETIDAGSGWYNPQDTAPFYVAVAGCTYPDTWRPTSNEVPAACPAAAAARARRGPEPTPALA